MRSVELKCMTNSSGISLATLQTYNSVSLSLAVLSISKFNRYVSSKLSRKFET